MAVLRVEREGSPSRHVTIAPGGLRLGRDTDCDVMLDIQFISRHHAEIRLVDERCEIADLGSINGTHIIGQRIPTNSWQEMTERDSVRIEEFSLRLVASPASSETVPRS